MALYPETFIEEVLAQNDIVEVVSSYIPLTRKGNRYWACCPFHGEKTPSFSVSPDRRLYYCFGCHQGGTAINFVMEMDRLSYPEAIRELATRARLPLPQVDPAQYKADQAQRERTLAACLRAAHFFHAQIWKPESRHALEYLHARGLSDAHIRRFGLGAAPPGWDGLYQTFTKEGFQADELKRAGLISERDDRRFDFFRDRVIFPIIDGQGRVIAFGARALGDAQPKYLNSPDTPIFSKRRNLYGLNFQKRGKNNRHLFLVEGYMDVVSLLRRGIEGCVATLGTALTADQARLMARYADAVTITYDGDDAGRNATAKALDVFEGINIRVRVLDFPDKQDPDEYLRDHSKEAFDALPREEATAFRLGHAARGLDLSKEEDRSAYAISACEILRGVADAVEQENYLRRLVVETGYPRDTLLRQIGAAPQKKNPQPENEVGRNRHTMGNPVPHRSPAEDAQRFLLAALAMDRARVGTVVAAEDFDDPLYREAARALLGGNQVTPLIASLDQESERTRLIAALQEPVQGDETLPGMVEAWLNTIRLARIEGEIKDIRQTMDDPKVRPDAKLMERMRTLQRERERRLAMGRKE